MKEKEDFRLIECKTNVIQWDNIKIFLCDLSKSECNNIIEELNDRKRWDKRYWSESTDEDKSNILQNVPVIYREEEKYINPRIPKWQSRYYQTLFENANSDIDEICRNYLEGLEWVFKYYTCGCPDWKWKYHYSYAPLLQDLLKYLRTNPTNEFVPITPPDPCSSYQQLAYVLPYQYLNLLPIKYCELLRTKYAEYYPKKWKFQWAFCRYFWEAHPVLKEMGMDILAKIK